MESAGRRWPARRSSTDLPTTPGGDMSSSTKAFKIRTRRSALPITVAIDGDEITATVTRFTSAQYGEFMRGFNRTQDPHSDRMITIRVPGEETEQREVRRALTVFEQA